VNRPAGVGHPLLLSPSVRLLREGYIYTNEFTAGDGQRTRMTGLSPYGRRRAAEPAAATWMLPRGIRGGLRCPQCARRRLAFSEAEVVCTDCGSAFPVLDGKPVLIHPQNEVFPLEAYRRAAGRKRSPASSWLKTLIPSPSTNLSGARCMRELASALRGRDRSRVLVVGSGDQKPLLEQRFGDFPGLELVHCDIAVEAPVDLLCDAHELPFVDGFFAGVIITGAMECVVSPETVAAEIHRVLRDRGLLYSEMPFVQQVVTGAYDFTRYTMSGHRRVFRRFEEISSGLRGGPGTVLLWAIERVVLSFLHGEPAHFAAKAAVRATLFWIKYIDYLVAKNPAALDAASGTYFYGRKVPGYELPDRALIERYSGAQLIRHV
jgi:hypothetical protein